MNFLNYKIKDYTNVEFIGKVFRKGKLNCLYGKIGIGKTLSTIKALNKDNIVPILLDFDDHDSPKEMECKFIHYYGWSFMGGYQQKDSEITIPKDYVIVIDTWAMFKPYKGFIDVLLSNKNTVILLGHTLDLASKQDMCDIDSELINHSSKLYLSYDKGNKTRDSGYILEIMKLRGYKGDMVDVN